jgi:hypothetical protein
MACIEWWNTQRIFGANMMNNDNVIPFPKKKEEENKVLDWGISYDGLFQFTFSLDDDPKVDFNATEWIDRLELDMDLESLFRKIQSGLREHPEMRQFVIAQLTNINKNIQKNS